MNRITIDEQYCKGCRICIDQCPKDVLEISTTRNPKGYLIPHAVRSEDCIGCMLCEMICPDMAITVEVTNNEK